MSVRTQHFVFNISAAALLAGMALPAAADPTRCERVWRLGYTFRWADGSGAGSVRGVDYDLIALLAQRASGCPMIQVQLPLTRVLKQIESGEIDVNGQKVCTPERGRYAWLLPYLRGKNHVLFRRDRGVAESAEAALGDDGLSIGIVRGGVYGAAYDAQIARLRAAGRIVEVPDLDTLYHQFRIGRFGAIVSTPPTYVAMLGERYLRESVRVVDWAPGEPVYPVCLLLSRKRFSADQAARIAEVLQGMRRDGSIQRIVERYLGAAAARDLVLPADVPAMLELPVP
ncbi:substrate-binding periplasmic protein [Chitinimonas koreensis]|uniref:substrate-binding periplasmic protein n=1 Tax=Chitinimonas koreensis TaxID=356302 RepID=UPI000411D703|nr:ABC transporter substrate-binding protein [Chitinimonas koreensis]QNM98369.1 transporter substrate-binding domain-containing protein [Chitinimonas koreensis]